VRRRAETDAEDRVLPVDALEREAALAAVEAAGVVQSPVPTRRGPPHAARASVTLLHGCTSPVPGGVARNSVSASANTAWPAAGCRRSSPSLAAGETPRAGRPRAGRPGLPRSPRAPRASSLR